MLRAKNKNILMRVLEKKRKTSIFGHFRPKRPILAKMAKMVKIIKKALGTFLSRLTALTNCKVSELMNGFREKALRMDARMYERTDVRTGLQRLRRETKNKKIKCFKIFDEKC